MVTFVSFSLYQRAHLIKDFCEFYAETATCTGKCPEYVYERLIEMTDEDLLDECRLAIPESLPEELRAVKYVYDDSGADV
jgi:hypothetical protein